MDTQLWNLFRETGDPMGYLLYKAEEQKEPKRKKPQGKTQYKTEKDGPAPSF